MDSFITDIMARIDNFNNSIQNLNSGQYKNGLIFETVHLIVIHAAICLISTFIYNSIPTNFGLYVVLVGLGYGLVFYTDPRKTLQDFVKLSLVVVVMRNAETIKVMLIMIYFQLRLMFETTSRLVTFIVSFLFGLFLSVIGSNIGIFYILYAFIPMMISCFNGLL